MNPPKSIFLTGATGFVGQQLCKTLLEQGFEITALVRDLNSIPDVFMNHLNFTSIEGSLGSIPTNLIQKKSYDAFLHAAWISTPGAYLKDPQNVTCLEGSVDLLKILLQCGVKRVVGLGTCIEYADTLEPRHETETPLDPQSLYAEAKIDCSEKFATMCSSAQVSSAWCRLFFPYGPGEHPKRLCSYIIQELLAGNPCQLKTPLNRNDYIYIDDCISAIQTVLLGEVQGPINIGAGQGIEVGYMAQQIAQILGKEHLIQVPKNPEQSPQSIIADNGKLRSLGWTPVTDFNIGIHKLINSCTTEIHAS